MTKIVSTDKARQGKRGRQVLIVLVVSLILAAIVWAGVEMFGEAIAPPAPDDVAPSTTSQPAPATQPSQ